MESTPITTDRTRFLDKPRRARSVFVAVLSGLLLSGCGSAEPGAANAVTGTGIPPLPTGKILAESQRPAALNALSIAGGAAPVTGDPYERALQCAVALNTLSNEMQNFPALVGETEKAALKKAQGIFNDRLSAEAARSDRSAQENRSELETRMQMALDDPAPQVQRAAGCLKELAGKAA